MVLAQAVGPGPRPGTERLYQTHHYRGGRLDVVALDPDTGTVEVWAAPVPEEGAWGLAVGPDGRLYLGTNPHAHLLRLDPRTGEIVDLGRPSPSEAWIWSLAVGADGRVYGGTSPGARLVRCDPRTARLEDLGRMDATDEYARSVAAADDGFVYLGVGTARTHLVAYEIASGTHRDVLPEDARTVGFPSVERGEDGRVYAVSGEHRFRLTGWRAESLAEGEAGGWRPAPRDRLGDGRQVTTPADGVFAVVDPTGGEETRRPLAYAGKEIDVFRLGLGPDGRLYGSAYLPARLFRVPLDRPRGGAGADGHDGVAAEELGKLGTGEVYAFLAYGPSLLGAAYYGDGPLLVYDPARPYAPGSGPEANPRLVTPEGHDPDWRPMAMIAGPLDRVYLGAIPGYGRLGGPLVVWDPRTDAVERFPHLVRDQSVVSLAAVDGLIAGGTTVEGGGGVRPTQAEAKLFLWDPVTRQTLFETTPVAGAAHVTGLVTAADGRVYGIAGGTGSSGGAGSSGGDVLFVFDPRERAVRRTLPLPAQRLTYQTMYNSTAAGADGQLWGLAPDAVFAVDPATETVRRVADLPEPFTAGFAAGGDSLYYASGPKVYRFRYR
jgi:outer membrane protein assembly factor BamB